MGTNRNLIIGSKEWEDYMTAPDNVGVVEKAKFYIARCTPRIGGFMASGALMRFIRDCVVIIEGPAKDPDFTLGRSKRNSAEALAIELACVRGPRCPENLVGSTYLVVRLESLFREISGLLSSWDGSWKSPNDRAIALQRSDTFAKKRGAKERLSDVLIAYELAVSRDNQSDPRAEHLRDLESKIASETARGVTQNLGQRIAQMRHSVAHGNPIGADSEGRFYSLLVIMLTFADPNWSPPT
jgi:hypothetical protein